MFTFMVVGDNLYRTNITTGDAWIATWGKWEKVKES